jgi:hypothetical protein
MAASNTDTLKIALISRISTLSNDEVLRQLEAILIPHPSLDSSDMLYRLARHIPKKLDIDALIIQQGFKGVDRTKFNRLVKKINIKEPLEQLLAAV